ncbi:hypothetical protein [Glaciecola sp. 33A]|jgi:hypothetical protein|uniref:hypothetical protein n=1 Tax=Glaciecola sp. 33A TaxID=2057807 RepID=UPI000C333D3D|nr:hypothetical protein [Glaciecola sp. 33A]PKI02240.1 hypothetical protein CXF81_07950 [Glaciecola sp. 33A]
MTIMRKVAFIAVSISALIYLVLQTSQGQLWLSKSQQSLLGEGTKETEFVVSNAPKQHAPKRDALIDSFTQFLNNSKHATQIAELEIQLKHMQTDIVEMAAAMQQLTALKNTLPEKKKMLGNAQIQTLQDNDTSVNVFAAPPKFQVTSTTLAVHDKQQNGPVVQTLASSQSRKADARMRQLEHQARLQEVVQQMESMALQAISR